MLLSPLSPDNQPATTPDPTLHTINYDFDLSDFSADNSVADDMLVLPNFLIFTLVGNWAKLVNDMVTGLLTVVVVCLETLVICCSLTIDQTITHSLPLPPQTGHVFPAQVTKAMAKTGYSYFVLS